MLIIIPKISFLTKFNMQLLPIVNKLLKTTTKSYYSTNETNNKLVKVNTKKKKTQIITTLEKLLNINKLDAHSMLRKYKTFSGIEDFLINENYDKLIENGITLSTIKMYPELLTENKIEYKLKSLKNLPHNINSIVILSTISLQKFDQFIRSELKLSKENCRISTMSRLLKIDIETVCNLICQKQFLINTSLKKFEENVKLLLSFGISTENIISDLWVLRYNNEYISKKLTLAKEHNIEELKTWMVRVQPDIFQTYVQRRSDNKLILGNNSLAEYLSERLQCSVDVAKYLITKQPVLKNKSLKKIKEIIDLLYSKGFKPTHICRVPKILSHSTHTTRERLQLLDSKGLQLESVHVLTKSQKQFKQYYDALLNKNKKK